MVGVATERQHEWRAGVVCIKNIEIVHASKGIRASSTEMYTISLSPSLALSTVVLSHSPSPTVLMHMYSQ